VHNFTNKSTVSAQFQLWISNTLLNNCQEKEVSHVVYRGPMLKNYSKL